MKLVRTLLTVACLTASLTAQTYQDSQGRRVDSSGNQYVVPVAGTGGTTSTQVQGPTAVGAADASTTNPVQQGAVDASNNVQKLSVDGSTPHNLNVSIAAAVVTGATSLKVQGGSAQGAVTRQPINIAGQSAGNVDTILSDGSGRLQIAQFQDAQGVTPTLTAVPGFADVRDRIVSATNTQTQSVYELRNLSQSLSIHAACSAGTAALTVEVSSDNTNWIQVDSLTAAQFQAKVYGSSTAGASAAAAAAGPLAPLSFRWVRITEATCGVGNTSTLTVAAK